MNISLFSKFLVSDDALWVYSGDRRIFASDQRHLLPLLEYINEYASYQKQVTILDRIMGNAAALLSVEADLPPSNGTSSCVRLAINKERGIRWSKRRSKRSKSSAN